MNDYLLTEAAEEFQLCLLQSLPKPEECTHVFSPKFERNMNRLITSGVYPRPASAARRIASFAAIFLVIITLLIALSPSAQASISGWIQRQYEKFTQFSFLGDSVRNGQEVEYSLTGLPDEYSELFREVHPGYNAVFYIDNISGNILCFYYSTAPTQVQVDYFLDIPIDSYEQVFVENNPGLFYQPSDKSVASFLQWSNNETNTFFAISAYLEKNQIIELAKKIKISSP